MINIIPNSQIRKINYYWQDILDYKPQDKISNSQIIPKNGLKSSSKIMIFHINQKSFLIIDPLLFDEVNSFISSHYSYKTVTAECFLKFFHSNVSKGECICTYYLTANNLVQDILDSDYLFRPLNSFDKNSLNNLKKSCLKAEPKISNIELTNPIVFGCFHENTLISAASLEYLQNDIANISILTHPNFKRNDIDKLTLEAVCQYGLSKNKIIQYKLSETDTYSKRIAETLGFKLYVMQENLELKLQHTEYNV